jgi:hypothetical protein
MTKKINCCGMDVKGIEAFIDDAEQQDKGTTRYPWPKRLKLQIRKEIEGMQFMPAVKEKVNEMVVAKAGPGLLGRGPFNLDPRVR